MNEISQKLGIRSTTLAKYMKALQQEFKLVRREVPFGQSPARSKKGLYLISDDTLACWFALVYGKQSRPSQEEMNRFLGRRFELFCIRFREDYAVERGERILKSGRWWGSVEIEKGKAEQRDIDLIVETEKTIFIGECKWTGDRMDDDDLIKL